MAHFKLMVYVVHVVYKNNLLSSMPLWDIVKNRCGKVSLALRIHFPGHCQDKGKHICSFNAVCHDAVDLLPHVYESKGAQLLAAFSSWVV